MRSKPSLAKKSCATGDDGRASPTAPGLRAPDRVGFAPHRVQGPGCGPLENPQPNGCSCRTPPLGSRAPQTPEIAVQISHRCSLRRGHVIARLSASLETTAHASAREFAAGKSRVRVKGQADCRMARLAWPPAVRCESAGFAGGDCVNSLRTEAMRVAWSVLNGQCPSRTADRAGTVTTVGGKIFPRGQGLLRRAQMRRGLLLAAY
jgi:hypothetical protein